MLLTLRDPRRSLNSLPDCLHSICLLAPLSGAAEIWGFISCIYWQEDPFGVCSYSMSDIQIGFDTSEYVYLP